jgi:hypothetical protein
MLTRSPKPVATDTWARSTYFFEEGIAHPGGDPIPRRIEIRYLAIKLATTSEWYDHLDWLQRFAPHEVLDIEPAVVGTGIVLMAYAVTNHETILPDEDDFLAEATATLIQRHWVRTPGCTIRVSLSAFEDMEDVLGYSPREE